MAKAMTLIQEHWNTYHFIVQAGDKVSIFISSGPSLRLEQDDGYSLANAGECGIQYQGSCFR
jgi:hypothetical protein